MSADEIINNKDVHKLVCEIVRSPYFLALKDAFCAHSPAGEDKTREDAIATAHGKNLGTRFVFNTMEKLSKQPPREKNNNRQQIGPDADLAT